jgi:hypothetical protein
MGAQQPGVLFNVHNGAPYKSIKTIYTNTFNPIPFIAHAGHMNFKHLIRSW